MPLLRKQGGGCACQPGEFRGTQVQCSHATGSRVPGRHRRPAAAMNATSFAVIHPGMSSQASRRMPDRGVLSAITAAARLCLELIFG